MANSVTISGASLGNSLAMLLSCEDIVPGAEPSYQLCKIIYLYHPLGAKMAEAPIKMAQFLPRELTIAEGPEEELKKAFNDQWLKDRNDFIIRNVGVQARVYGLSSLAIVEEDGDSSTPLDLKKIATSRIAFNVFDPLNTAGSLVLNQDPNAIDFQKHVDIAVQGKRYHRSRTVTLMNEQPIYIAYTSSSFGFVGRSVYQRALFPLKSFINTMITDDMVARKAGLIVATMKIVGSIVDAVMTAGAAFRRRLLKVAETDNVISINEGETVTSIDLTNIDGAMTTARKNILENIATAADMPANMLNQETFAEGFGEGTEDAKKVAAYVDAIRAWLDPLYEFMTMITQRRAWNEDLYKSLKSKYKLKDSYEDTFYQWQNAFSASWPSLLREPESEQVRVADTKLKAVIAAVQVLAPELDPENKVNVLMWAQDQFNATKELFSIPLELDADSLLANIKENKDRQNKIDEANVKEPEAPPPFSARDSALAAYLGSKPDNGDLRRRLVKIEDFIQRRHG